MGIRSRLPDVRIPWVSITDFLLADVDKYADFIAVVDTQSDIKYTYGDVRNHVRSIGSALTRKGFRKGDVLCIYCPNVPEFPLVLLGTLAVGGIVTTCNPQYTAEELEKQMNLAHVQYIITVPECAEKAIRVAATTEIKAVYVLGSAQGCTPFTELLNDSGSAFPDDVNISPQDVALLPFSSGTTGLPKGVMLTHYNIVANLLQSRDFIYTGRPGVDFVLGYLPFFHGFGLLVINIGSIKFKQTIVCMRKFDFEDFLAAIEKYKIRYLFAAPPIVIRMAKHPSVAKYDLSCVETIMSASAPLGSDSEEELEARLGTCSLTQGYGLTETGPFCSLPPLSRHLRRPGASGVLVPNTECKVVDPITKKELGPNQDGELWFRGPQVFIGYLNNPVATAATLDKDGWIHTGDIGHYDEDQYLYIKDRIKEMIKFKGFQVAPAELESVLVTHPAVEDAAVVGRPDQEAGELPMAFVVLKSGRMTTERDIMDFLAEKLAPYKRLRGGVVIVKSIPKTESGKILRRFLRAGLRERVEKMKAKL